MSDAAQDVHRSRQRMPARSSGVVLLVLAAAIASITVVLPGYGPLYPAICVAGYAVGVALPRGRGNLAAMQRVAACCAGSVLVLGAALVEATVS